MPEPLSYKTASTHLPNSDIQGPVTAMVDTGTQFSSTQEASKQQAMPAQSSNLAAAASMMTPATIPGNNRRNKYYTEEEFAKLLRGS